MSDFLDALKFDEIVEFKNDKEKELYEIFDQVPVSIQEFISNPDYLGASMSGAKLSEIQYDFVKHFTQVLRDDTYRLLAECRGDAYKPTRHVNNLAVAWG